KEVYKENKSFSISEKDLGKYFQGWAKLLEKKQNIILNEGQINNKDLDNVIYPTLDKDAKWQLENMFIILKLSLA
ncbi:7248_t:CDS:1, partial [Cetraspora pellucida]